MSSSQGGVPVHVSSQWQLHVWFSRSQCPHVGSSCQCLSGWSPLSRFKFWICIDLAERSWYLAVMQHLAWISVIFISQFCLKKVNDSGYQTLQRTTAIGITEFIEILFCFRRAYLMCAHYCSFQGILHLRGRPTVAYDQQGLVFAVAMEGGAIKLFDSRSFDKVCTYRQQVKSQP